MNSCPVNPTDRTLNCSTNKHGGAHLTIKTKHSFTHICESEYQIVHDMVSKFVNILNKKGKTK